MMYGVLFQAEVVQITPNFSTAASTSAEIARERWLMWGCSGLGRGRVGYGRVQGYVYFADAIRDELYRTAQTETDQPTTKLVLVNPSRAGSSEAGAGSASLTSVRDPAQLFCRLPRRRWALKSSLTPRPRSSSQKRSASDRTTPVSR
jgi:hypothetical protein